MLQAKRREAQAFGIFEQREGEGEAVLSDELPRFEILAETIVTDLRQSLRQMHHDWAR